MAANRTRASLEWQQLPFIIIAGFLIGLIFGQASQVLVPDGFVKAEKPRLVMPAKRTG